MKKTKKGIICGVVVLCALLAASIYIRPLNEDPPSALSSPVYSNIIC